MPDSKPWVIQYAFGYPNSPHMVQFEQWKRYRTEAAALQAVAQLVKYRSLAPFRVVSPWGDISWFA